MLLCLSSGTDLQKSQHVLKSLSLCNKVLSYLSSLPFDRLPSFSPSPVPSLSVCPVCRLVTPSVPSLSVQYVVWSPVLSRLCLSSMSFGHPFCPLSVCLSRMSFGHPPPLSVCLSVQYVVWSLSSRLRLSSLSFGHPVSLSSLPL